MVGVVINMQKDLIKKRFAKSLKTYEDNAIVQKEMAKKLSSIIDGKEYSTILELGCGTGLLTKEIINKVKFETYCAIDIVGECKNFIDKLSPKINFIETDIEKFIPSSNPDLVVSNASLQWIEDLPNYVKKIRNCLSENGEFIFTLFGRENYKEFSPFTKTPLKNYGKEELKNICSDYKVFEAEENITVLEFNSPKEVLYHIKNTGVNALSQMSWTKSDLKFFENNYPKTNGKYPLTYHPIYVKLIG